MLGLYVHIPFCRSRCSYCDFFLITRLDHVERFFKALSRETELRRKELEGRTIGSIHFGGGTPSLVPLRHIASWLDQVSGLCSFSPDVEIAFEANPEDLDGNLMDDLLGTGVNRLSLGVQSFCDRKLLALGRKHTAAEARSVTDRAMRIFPSVSADLICGVPGEDRTVWESDLDAALDLGPHHLSVYMLSLEPKTLLCRDVSRGLLKVPGEDQDAAEKCRGER